jgi:ubiquinone biosynthesis protein UbiJ
MDRATRSYAKTSTLHEAENVENLVLFIDDDLRETAMSIQRIESYLVDTLSLLEQEEVSRAEVSAHVGDQKILDHVDQLNETLESLRRRMARLAASLR